MRKTKVTILTGYLGSGKTTILNALLQQEAGRGSAVIVNEFGAVSIDAQLVVGVDEDVLEINNGCICCTVRTDLVTTIARLLTGSREITRIIVETTGLADPAPIIQSFVLDDSLRATTQLDAVVTVVDARHNAHWLRLGYLDEADGRENTAKEQIAFADVILLNKCDLVEAPDVDGCEGELRALNPLAKIVRVANGNIDAAYVLEIGAFDLGNALRLEPELLEDAEHLHDQSITSVVVEPDAPLDEERFFRWLNRYVQAKGDDNLRIKGIVAIAGQPRRYAFHGVHMTLDGRPSRPWRPGEPKRGTIVFIGRHLDKEALQTDIRDCLAEPALA